MTAAAAKLHIKAPPRYVGEVDARDLDAFINAAYGLPEDGQVGHFSCHADQEWPNDGIVEVHVGPDADEFDRAAVEEVRTRRYGGWKLNALLDTLAAAGVIPAGEYLIRL